jgi:hypothetical protein
VAYWDVAQLSNDVDWQTRVAACVAVEGDISDDPTQWAFDQRWQLAAQPGWADAYAYAVQTGVPDPGRDPAVITDSQLLSGVQAVAGP